MTDRLDPSGVFSLITIVWVLVAGFAYSKWGWIGGGFTCGVLFCIFLFGGTDSRSNTGIGFDIGSNDNYIANWSQTKFLNEEEVFTADYGCIYIVRTLYGEDLLDKDKWAKGEKYIPVEELTENANGDIVMKSSGEGPKSYSIINDDGIWDQKETSKERFDYRMSRGSISNPDNYLYKNDDGVWVNGKTHIPPTDDDFYLPRLIIDKTNASTSDGGWGIPQWLYHPASAIYVFGFFMLPLIGASKVIKS